MPKVFVSRNLSDDDPSLKPLLAADFELYCQSLIHFSPANFMAVPEADWCFFYSQQAVRFFAEGCRAIGYRPAMRMAAMGSATAAVMWQMNWPVDFIGTGKPQKTAADFSVLAKGKRVLFPQAANSRQSVQHLLAKDISTLSLIVYHNQPLAHFTLPPCDYLLFTSPMNVQVYFTKYPLLARQRVGAIGRVTAAALSEAGVRKVSQVDLPELKKLLELPFTWSSLK